MSMTVDLNRVGAKGAGQVTVTSFSVPAGSLEVWRTRLTGHRRATGPTTTRFGEQAMQVTDPSGLAMELVANDRDARQPWNGGGVEPAYAVRGLHSVTMTLRSPDRTIDMMTSLLGFRIVGQDGGRTRRLGTGRRGAGGLGGRLEVAGVVQVAGPHRRPERLQVRLAGQGSIQRLQAPGRVQQLPRPVAGASLHEGDQSP